jgi:hypothetical protein
MNLRTTWLLLLLGIFVVSSIGPICFASTNYSSLGSSNIRIVTTLNVCCGASLVYNGAAHDVYAITTGSHVAVIDAANKVLANISLTTGVSYYLFDSAYSKLYLSNGNAITAIQGAKIVSTVISTVSAPSQLTLDSASKQIYFLGVKDRSVYLDALSAITNKFSTPIFLTKISCGYDCSNSVYSLAVNPAGGSIFVNMCQGSGAGIFDTTDVFDTGGKLVTYLFDQGGNGNCGMVESADPANGDMYIMDSNTFSDPVCAQSGNCSNVVALNSRDKVVAAFPPFKLCQNTGACYGSSGTASLFYNSGNREMYASCGISFGMVSPCFGFNYSSGQFDYSSIAIGSTNKVVYQTNYSLSSILLDVANKDIWVSGIGSKVDIINTNNKIVGSFPFEVYCCASSFAYAPTNKDVYFDNSTKLFVVTPSNFVTKTFEIGCSSMVFNQANSDVYCSGYQRIFVLSS